MEKTLTNIPGLEPSQEVIIQKFGYKSMKEVRNRAVKLEIKNINGKPVEQPSVLMGELQTAFVVFGIKKAPFFKEGMTSEQKWAVVDNDDFDTRIVDYLYPKIAELNNVEKIQELKKK